MGLTEDSTNNCLVKKSTVKCFNSRCQKRCTNDGFISGECTKIGSEWFNKCYCKKDGCDNQSPVDDSVVAPSVAPVDSSSDLSPTSRDVSDLSPSSGNPSNIAPFSDAV